MLKQRVVTAVALLVILLAVLLAPTMLPFRIFMAVAIGLAAWEWARLTGYQGLATYLWAGVTLCACMTMAMLGWPDARHGAVRGLYAVVSLAWIGGGSFLLRSGVDVWQRLPQLARMAFGVLSLSTGWLAMVQLHSYGIVFLLSVLALVWAADIGAYFAGKAFGKRKLAPTISPGKSWAGVYGGMVAGWVLLLVGAFMVAAPNFYSSLSQRMPLWAVWLTVVILVAMSVVGDLVESLMKRSMGMKDSSQLLPGHGGVLDRVDGLLPVLPMAMALILYLE